MLTLVGNNKKGGEYSYLSGEMSLD